MRKIFEEVSSEMQCYVVQLNKKKRFKLTKQVTKILFSLIQNIVAK